MFDDSTMKNNLYTFLSFADFGIKGHVFYESAQNSWLGNYK